MKTHQMSSPCQNMNRPVPVACKLPPVPIKREQVFYHPRPVVCAPGGRQAPAAPNFNQFTRCQPPIQQQMQPQMQPQRQPVRNPAMNCCYSTPQPCQQKPLQQSMPQRPYSCHQPSLSCPQQQQQQQPQQQQQTYSRQSVAYPPQFFYNNCIPSFGFGNNTNSFGYNSNNCSFSSTYGCRSYPNY